MRSNFTSSLLKKSVTNLINQPVINRSARSSVSNSGNTIRNFSTEYFKESNSKKFKEFFCGAFNHQNEPFDYKTLVADLSEEKIKKILQETSNDEENLLHEMCHQSMFDDATNLIEKYEAGFNKKNKQGFSPIDFAGLHDDDKAKSFLKKFLGNVDDDKVEKFIIAARSKFFVNLFYSFKDIPIFPERFFSIIKATFPIFTTENKESKESKDFILDILNKVKHNEILDGQDGKLRLMMVPYRNHASFFIIRFNKENVPVALSYCDGNMPLNPPENDNEYGKGEVIFLIDQEKIQNLGVTLEQHLSNPFENKDCSEFYKDGGKEIKNVLRSVVNCSGDDNEPLIVAENIPTTKQAVGNCVPKAFFILVRATFQWLRPEMTFGYDKNYAPLPGQEIYDKIKEQARSTVLNCLLELSSPDFKNYPHYPVVLDALNVVFMKAIKEGEISIVGQAYNALKDSNFNFATHENFSNLSKLFLSNKPKLEVIEFLCQKTSILEDRDFNDFSFLSKLETVNSVNKNENFDLIIEGMNFFQKTKEGVNYLVDKLPNSSPNPTESSVKFCKRTTGEKNIGV